MEWGFVVIMLVRKMSYFIGVGGFFILFGLLCLCGVCLFRSFSMVIVGMNDVKNGMKILVNNELVVIIEIEYVKLGKG